GRARRCELPRQRDPEPGLHPLRGGDGVHAGARRGDAAEPAHRPAGARARRRDAPAPLPQRAGLPARGVHTRHGHTHAPAGPDRARAAGDRAARDAAAVVRARCRRAALLLAWVWVRRLVPASKLLGITDPASLLTAARIDRDLDRRAAAAAQVRAQDRRHLPPNLGTETLGAAATMHGALRALGLIARADLLWVLPAAAGIGWLLFGITDLVTVISRLSAADP